MERDWIDLEYRKDPRDDHEIREPQEEDCLDQHLFTAIHNNLYYLRELINKKYQFVHCSIEDCEFFSNRYCRKGFLTINQCGSSICCDSYIKAGK